MPLPYPYPPPLLLYYYPYHYRPLPVEALSRRAEAASLERGGECGGSGGGEGGDAGRRGDAQRGQRASCPGVRPKTRDLTAESRPLSRLSQVRPCRMVPRWCMSSVRARHRPAPRSLTYTVRYIQYTVKCSKFERKRVLGVCNNTHAQGQAGEAKLNY